ncbi:MAG: EpsG family protein [Petrimonas sp.]|nr:EpsG family protein [Petrimonas sp.]
MIETILLGIGSVFFAYLSRYKNLHWGLKLSFVFIFLFLAFRYDFGNDYQGYLLRFGTYQSEKLNLELFKLDLFEPGWIILNWLFKDIGFFNMTILLAFFNSLLYYHFIVKYVPSKYYWLAVFFYIFNNNLLLIQLSAMRQAVAIMLFILSIDFLNKKNIIKFIVCIVIASFFHYTAILLALIFFLVNFNKKIGNRGLLIVLLIYICLILGGKFLTPYLFGFISIFSEKYEFYQDKGVVNSGIGFIYYSFILILLLYNEKKQNREVRLIFKISILSILIMPLSLILDIMGRFTLYLTPATIVAYPNLISKMKNPLFKIIIVLIICTFTLFQFYNFFNSTTYNEYFMDYKTIFSAPRWY